MDKLVYKRVSLTVICISMLALLFAITPAISQGQRGPVVDTIRHKVTRSPAAQLIEMTVGAPTGSDMWMGMIRPDDVIEMNEQGKTVSSTPMFHFCEFGFNYRVPPLDDVNFRHALAHLVPKKAIIGTLFKFITGAIDTPVPPAQGKWHNPLVDSQAYSPATAETILAAAGYEKIGGEWKMPGGGDMGTLRCYIPLEIVAPTSYTIGKMFVDECTNIGLNNIVLEPMDFSTYTDKAFDEWDFEIFWVCWGLGSSPTQLYSFFHSENGFLGSYNPYGIAWPELDEQIDIFYKELDHTAKVPAVHLAQEMLMGGTILDPLAIPAQPERAQAIPLLPVYSRNAYDTQHPDIRGAINVYGSGIDNGWTWMNVHWDVNDDGVPDNRPGTSDNMVVPVFDEFPERLNPMGASTVYAWTMLDPTFDGLIATNPFTQRDMPWMATEWSYGTEAGGMWVKFNLRTTDDYGDPIVFQDGDPIAPSDVEFAWEFLADHQIPRYWSDFKYYDYTDIVGTEITAHMTETSQWMIYDLASVALMVPPQVWGPWVGSTTDDILSWDPSAEAGPAGLPTKVYGTGPFILQHDTIWIATKGYGDLVANRDYWLTTEDIQGNIAEWFHRAGDVDSDGEVRIPGDLATIGFAWDTVPGMERFDLYPEADITSATYPYDPDDHIYGADLIQAGQSYGARI